MCCKDGALLLTVIPATHSLHCIRHTVDLYDVLNHFHEECNSQSGLFLYLLIGLNVSHSCSLVPLSRDTLKYYISLCNVLYRIGSKLFFLSSKSLPYCNFFTIRLYTQLRCATHFMALIQNAKSTVVTSALRCIMLRSAIRDMPLQQPRHCKSQNILSGGEPQQNQNYTQFNTIKAYVTPKNESIFKLF